MPLLRTAFRTEMRAACERLLAGWAADTDSELPSGGLQVYRTIPTSIKPPTAFVERITERQTFTGPTQRQRNVTATVLIVWSLFAEMERGDAVDQLDLFMDGFSEYVLNHYHEVSGTSIVSSAVLDEDPYYVFRDPQKGNLTYYAGRVLVEGYIGH